MEETDMQNLPLVFRPELDPAFTMIVNQLDPKSFSKLAATGKAVRDACLHTRGVAVPFYPSDVVVTKEEDDFRFKLWCRQGIAFGPWETERITKLMETNPFEVHIKLLALDLATDHNVLTLTREYLASINVKSIEFLDIWNSVDCWDEIRQLMKEFGVKSLVVIPQIPRRVFSTPEIQQLSCLKCCEKVSRSLLIASHIPKLTVFHKVSRRTFKEIVQKFLSDQSLISWTVTVSHSDFSLAFDAITSLPVDFDGEFPPDRPLLFRSDETTVFLLSSHDKVIHCKRGNFMANLWKSESLEYPSALKRYFASKSMPVPSTSAPH